MGVDLVVSVGTGTVGPVDVAVVAVLSALAGWGVVRLLERYSRFPQARWPFVGSTAIAISINGPGWLSDVASMAALIVLHFVVGIVVIMGFAPTLPYVRADAAPVSGRHDAFDDRTA
jgi:hypothetical protein